MLWSEDDGLKRMMKCLCQNDFLYKKFSFPHSYRIGNLSIRNSRIWNPGRWILHKRELRRKYRGRKKLVHNRYENCWHANNVGTFNLFMLLNPKITGFWQNRMDIGLSLRIRYFKRYQNMNLASIKTVPVLPTLLLKIWSYFRMGLPKKCWKGQKKGKT